jgi:hypothetical protein
MIREITGMLDETLDQQAGPERKAQPEHRDAEDGPVLRRRTGRSQLGSGEEHQEDEAELVEAAQHRRGRPGLGEQRVLDAGSERAEDGRAEQQASEDLTDHGRLPQNSEEVAEKVRQQDEER